MKPVVCCAFPNPATRSELSLIAAGLILLVAALLPVISVAKPIERQLPDSCQTLVEYELSTLPDDGNEQAEAGWNRYYLAGQAAIEQGDLRAALQAQCMALYQARSFNESDWRFAEALDELGRIHYLLEEYNESEQAQGAAVAELLLTVGPDDRGPPKIRNVRIFIERLGLVYAQQGRADLTDALLAEPYTIYDMGYLPLDRELARRLDWLVSEYLGLGNFTAANELMALIAEIE